MYPSNCITSATFDSTFQQSVIYFIDCHITMNKYTVKVKVFPWFDVLLCIFLTILLKSIHSSSKQLF